MPPTFRYLRDPVCPIAMVIYCVGRWVLRPLDIGGVFTQWYLNDVLCLPLFLPIILLVQRKIRLRDHDGFPTVWELLQHWLVFSIVFEVVLPRFPQWFRTVADPWDVVAYFIGGLLAAGYWAVTLVRFRAAAAHEWRPQQLSVSTAPRSA